MLVVALLVPMVMLALLMALAAYEDLLFPPSRASQHNGMEHGT